MKPNKKIEQSLRRLSIQPRAPMHEKTLADIVETHSEYKVTRDAASRPEMWRAIMRNRTLRFAAAAVITVAFVVPISYGTGNLIKRLTGGSYGTDECRGPFQLDTDIRVELQTGTKEQPRIVSARSIRFFVEDAQIRATLRCGVETWPRYEWRTRIELLDASGNRLAHTEQVNANAGVEMPAGRQTSSQSTHFSLGSAARVAEVRDFKVRFERASEKETITPEAWAEGGGLTVIHGRVTNASGQPIPGVVVQIRGTRPAGQTYGAIWMRNVVTDRQGSYCSDDTRGSYRISAIVYESVASSKGYRHQYRRLGKVWEGSQTINFEFDRFPTGGGVLSGTATDPNGSVMKEFTVDIRLNVDLNDESGKDLYAYSIREPLVTSDGQFRVANLSAGTYEVAITPTASRVISAAAFAGRRSYVCDLREGQEMKVGPEQAKEKVWYGRALFEDGTPAVLSVPEFKTQLVAWGPRIGMTIGTADQDGYFAVPIPDERAKQFKSKDVRLTVIIGPADALHEMHQGTEFPLESLSLERGKAGTLRIPRPRVCYGRVLYEDGKPAVPPVAPWSDATVSINLRSVNRSIGGPYLGNTFRQVDKDGYFSVCLSEDLLKKITDGQVELTISHPLFSSRDEERINAFVGRYPVDMLASERDSAAGYAISFAAIPSEWPNPQPYLESGYRMRDFAALLKRYADAHTGNYPGALEQVDTPRDDLARLGESIEYVPPLAGPASAEPAETVLAYDKDLLKKALATLVLFRDGHIEYCWPRRLSVLGISRTDQTTK